MSGGVRTVLIVGGGTAGWMTAAALACKLKGLPVRIRLVESAEIGTVGVGEATVPHIRFFNATLGLDEAEFMRATKATFKLGIEFRNWGRIGDSYIHPFGSYGTSTGGVNFLQLWTRYRLNGGSLSLEEFSLPVQASRLGRFSRPSEDLSSIASTFSYAYQFDASLYARVLRSYAEERGVERYEGKIVEVQRRSDDGWVERVVLEDGSALEADLFVDCSGFRSLLVGQTLGAAFQSWAHWLPCDRAIALPCSGTDELTPYTRATACDAGWIWRIPLQHRTGNGHVYCSAFTDDETAERTLVEQLDGEPLASPNRLRFEAGKRDRQWVANCVAIGLSAGFLEPLESTSIHLIQLAIGRLIEFLPLHGWDPADAAEYNRLMDIEYERIRDFLILHYCATDRSDSPFWDYVRTMPLPDSLEEKIDLFRHRGAVSRYRDGMFLEPSWIAVYVGQNILPQGYDPRADKLSASDLERQIGRVAAGCRFAAQAMPSHWDYLAQLGAAA
ncbi:tryptophan halogenase family protein [Sphingomonas arenae]|uniref:tryptophan halogenase family protein n=1 Tax=Sphingomonas arenae TaxID=2812555 RepID=UPI0019672C1D|nr:tryptophan halogenase family protein [Sphingomonas arenae]